MFPNMNGGPPGLDPRAAFYAGIEDHKLPGNVKWFAVQTGNLPLRFIYEDIKDAIHDYLVRRFGSKLLAFMDADEAQRLQEQELIYGQDRGWPKYTDPNDEPPFPEEADVQELRSAVDAALGRRHRDPFRGYIMSLSFGPDGMPRANIKDDHPSYTYPDDELDDDDDDDLDTIE